MTAASARPAGTFSSLRNRNFRLYYIGQGISTAGTFMQAVGQSWLVLKLTGSGTALGFVTMLQFLPLLIFGGYAGVIVDRYDRRRLYIITQTLNMILALVLGILTVAGVVELWMVYTLAFALGLVTTLDQPVRQRRLEVLLGPHQGRRREPRCALPVLRWFDAARLPRGRRGRRVLRLPISCRAHSRRARAL